MSEQLPIKGHESLENSQTSPEYDAQSEATSEKQRSEELRRSSELIESARNTIDKQAVSSEVPVIEKQAEQSNQTMHNATKHIKNVRYKTTLTHVRHNLSPTQRVLSKIVHQSVIESISEIGAKTIARPSGLLGGGLIALIASLTVTIIARRVGFVVPSSIFAITFVGGFGLGLIVEAIFRSVKKSRKHTRI
jgi:hypothetical protein